MGLFNGKTQITSAISYIKNNIKYDYQERLNNYDFSALKKIISDEELICELLYKMARNNIEVDTFLTQITEIYSLICVKKDIENELQLYNKLVDLFVKFPKLFKTDSADIFQNVCVSFDDKNLVYELYNYIIDSKGIIQKSSLNEDNLAKIMSYASKARKYYVDDRALLSSVINFLDQNDIKGYIYSRIDVNDIVEEKLKEDRKACGIYNNIDKTTLAELDNKLEELESIHKLLTDVIENASQIMDNTKLETENIKKEINHSKSSALTKLQTEADKVLTEFNMKYLQLLEEVKTSLYNERDNLLAETKKEISEIKNKTMVLYNELSKSIRDNKFALDNAASASIEKIDGYIRGNDEIKRLISESQQDSEFVKKINEISKLVDNKTIKGILNGDNSTIQNGGSAVIVPNIILPDEERPVDFNINHFFDTSISFEKRFEEFSRRKEKDIKNNKTIYHKKFDDIVKIVMKGNTPYMYGPSGCGKTYMIESQLANLLNINVVTSGYILYEQDIIGYNNAGNGAYVPVNFYRCYKYGDTIFLDELDNGVANSTVVLNRFLGTNNKQYTFPDGKVTLRNPNFRIIAAGNTSGNGRNVAYNTRQKLDESVLQRLTPVAVNYDNRIEERILKDYPAWFNFAVNFRKAIESIPSNTGEEVNTIGTFTTRDANAVKEYLDDKCFNDEQILEYHILQTKNIDTLTQLSNKMHDIGDFTNGGTELLNLYDKLLTKRKKR